jgi:hypothetical protein
MRLMAGGGALTPVVASAGDRIVVERGFYFTNTVSTAAGGTLYRSTDELLPDDSGLAAALGGSSSTTPKTKAWLEFSKELWGTPSRRNSAATTEVLLDQPRSPLILGGMLTDALIDPPRVPLQLGAMTVNVMRSKTGKRIRGIYTGGAGDIWETDWEISKVARQMGAVSWPRVTGSFATNQHTHLVLIGCLHLHPQGVAQIREAYAGGDGLLGDLPDEVDLHSYLWPKRNWREGIAWHREQQLRRKRIAKLEAARARKAKYQRLVKKVTVNINRLKELV